MAMIEDKMKMKKTVDRSKMKKKFVIPEYILVILSQNAGL
jgi:hypothetical protein